MYCDVTMATDWHSFVFLGRMKFALVGFTNHDPLLLMVNEET